MPNMPGDFANADSLSSFGSLNEPKSPTHLTSRCSVTEKDDKQGDDVERHTLMCRSNAGSQDWEDWPLPEIPFDQVPVKPVDSLYAMPDLDKPVPKSFCWKASLSFQQSQDSLDWPSPPSSAIGAPIIVENIETYYASEAQSADKVIWTRKWQ
ncbi:GM17457 [Drosophila sechellia]|uniref:GM17457 n=1 Tax=Drosophila sechellia TaxID=7238 RepID=B4IQC6_DROSE|nr:GM17457 [Drosophila sechellia]